MHGTGNLSHCFWNVHLRSAEMSTTVFSDRLWIDTAVRGKGAERETSRILLAGDKERRAPSYS